MRSGVSVAQSTMELLGLTPASTPSSPLNTASDASSVLSIVNVTCSTTTSVSTRAYTGQGV